MCNEMKPWEPYLPEHVCLYYVDYNSNLDGNTKQLQKCIEDNNLYPISESIDEWWDFPEGQYLEDMQRAMENDDIEWEEVGSCWGFFMETEELIDEVISEYSLKSA